MGGSEKSLLSVLSRINYSKYSVDVLAFNPQGIIASCLPPQVNVLPLPDDYRTSKLGLKAAVAEFMKSGNWGGAYHQLMYSLTLKKYGYTNIAEQKAYEHFRYFFRHFSLKYDAAISYLEKTTNYLVADLINAEKKIGYIHSDYNKLLLDIDIEKHYLGMLDSIVTVSDSCAEIMKKTLPDLQDKIVVIENIVSKKELTEKSGEFNPYNDGFDGTRIVSVGRISEEKGTDIEVSALSRLLKAGYDVKWHHVGDGEYRAAVESLVQELDVADRYIFEGATANPYPYIHYADIFVQSSRYEGKSISIEEAKLLEKPIVATRFTTAESQLSSGETGIICDIDEKSVSDSVVYLIDNPEIRKNLIQNLLPLTGNEGELDKLLNLL